MKIHLSPSLVLTTERTECRGRIPVLVNRADDSTVYRASDLITVYNSPPQPAANVVKRCAGRLDAEGKGAADQFLRQWEGGPQLR